MPKLIMLVGPPAAGKSSYASKYADDADYIYVNQDSQGREHLTIFEDAISDGYGVVVDRLNHLKEQRQRYLQPAKDLGYETEIIVLHENYETCLNRCLARQGHETIKDSKDASRALNMFFTKYERVEDDEADVVTRKWPEGDKEFCVVVDLDGTLANNKHREYLLKQDKKDWSGFFSGIPDDSPNYWCAELITHLRHEHQVVYASGRPDDYRELTEEWLKKHSVDGLPLFMRRRGDFRSDTVIKETILDFELLTRWKPYFFIDDRQCVVDMWRSRGYTCLQCAPGAF